MAGLRPGFGRGGITHSFDVMEPGVPGPGDGATEGLAANAGAMASEGTVAGAGVRDTPVVAIMVAVISSSAGLGSAGTWRGARSGRFGRTH